MIDYTDTNTQEFLNDVIRAGSFDSWLVLACGDIGRGMEPRLEVEDAISYGAIITEAQAEALAEHAYFIDSLNQYEEMHRAHAHY